MVLKRSCLLPFGELTPYDQGWMDKILPDLEAQIKKGEDFCKQIDSLVYSYYQLLL